MIVRRLDQPGKISSSEPKLAGHKGAWVSLGSAWGLEAGAPRQPAFPAKPALGSVVCLRGAVVPLLPSSQRIAGGCLLGLWGGWRLDLPCKRLVCAEVEPA